MSDIKPENQPLPDYFLGGLGEIAMRQVTKRDLCLSLNAAGRSHGEIAKALQVPIDTVLEWIVSDRGAWRQLSRNMAAEEERRLEALKQRALTLIFEGVPIDKVADTVGMPHPTVALWVVYSERFWRLVEKAHGRDTEGTDAAAEG